MIKNKKKSKSERLGSWSFFCREFLNFEANILFAKYAASSVFKRFTKVKVGKLYKLISFRTVFFLRHQVLCNLCTGMIDFEKSSSNSSFRRCYLGCPRSPRWSPTISSMWTELASNNYITYSWPVDKGSSEQLHNISVCGIASDTTFINALGTKTSLQLLFENI